MKIAQLVNFEVSFDKEVYTENIWCVLKMLKEIDVLPETDLEAPTHQPTTSHKTVNDCF
jgi:hypothetical protein